MNAPHVAFVLEQTLGHGTHADNLRRLIPRSDDIDATFIPIDFDLEGWTARVPGIGNLTVRAGLHARRVLHKVRAQRPIDAMFVHTQVPAILMPDLVKQTPTVVSLDATPRQYDQLGHHYGHTTRSPRLERLKWHANRACFERAAHIVTWAAWTRHGLIDEYGIAGSRITVVPPGVDVSRWKRPDVRSDGDGPTRILFVGGNLERKGGLLLLDAFRALRDDPAMPELELHLVTKTAVPAERRVMVHTSMAPNSPELVALFHRSHIFCLPTLGDCLPMVLSEAGATGLPLVSTDVGAIAEIVRHGETGLLVPTNDVAALRSTLATLVGDRELRGRLGDRAVQVVGESFDAERNAMRLVELVRDVRDAKRRSMNPQRGRVLLTVSGTMPPDLDDQIAAGVRPRPDFLVMAEAFGADLVDHARARASTGRLGKVIERLAGPNVLVAWSCFRQRRRYDVVFTDGEQVGIPFAAMTRFAGRGGARHVMIVHILTVRKKMLLMRALRLTSRIDRMVVYSSRQRDLIAGTLSYPSDRIVLSPFMVDTTFFSPNSVETPRRRMICSAGLEFRDYPTMIEAVRGLDVDVVLAAASPWSKRRDVSGDVEIPANVTVEKYGFVDLRTLYASAALVVVPLVDSDFQAGITTILEAMAMGKAIICTRTRGQVDVIVNGSTGMYVPPGDARALRSAIEHLLADHDLALRLGTAARSWAAAEADIETYACRLAGVVDAVASTTGR